MSPEWGGPEKRQPTYGEHSDLTKVLRTLDNVDHAVADLHHLYPWMLDVDPDAWIRARIAFVNAAVPLQNAGQDTELQLLAERFIHSALAARPDKPEPRPSLWRRLLPWLFPACLTAWLLTGVAVFG